MQPIVRTWSLLWLMTWAIPILVATAERSRRPIWTAWPRMEFVTLRLIVRSAGPPGLVFLPEFITIEAIGFSNTALIGEILKPAGYRTWWSGKHHATFNPHGRGFDHFSGFLGGAINFWNPGDKARAGEDAPGWKAVYTWAFDDNLVKPYQPSKDFFATDAFTDWSLEWLEEKERADAPFFLYLAYNAPHGFACPS